MQNSFFSDSLDRKAIQRRILELEAGKVGFYSIGLYPGSIAYNCAMQTDGKFLRLATRPGRELMGAFHKDSRLGMDPDHVVAMKNMAVHEDGDKLVPNTLADLIETCELVVLSANSNHIEQDVEEACALRSELNREQVVLACLAGSFSHDYIKNESYVLCEKWPNLAFFSGFHRHGALRNPLDSFTANFCHPNAITALLGAHLLDKLSPNIQVSPGVHNIEAQYIKAAKNISSIFAGFGYSYHSENTGTLPTLLTLLLDQCIDQAATVSMARRNRQQIYSRQPIALTELGYGVQRIEATLSRGGNMEKVRDHTFSQLTAMVADVRGSMLMPVSGSPTRNFQAGQILAEGMRTHERCPRHIEEFEEWCEQAGLNKGGLEGLKALRYWPQIVQKYNIPIHDASMVNLLYMLLYGTPTTQDAAFLVMTKSRELSNYCQESVRPSHSRKYAEALQHIDKPEALDLVTNAVIADNARRAILDEDSHLSDSPASEDVPAYLKMMNVIENVW
ncbi:MAG: hypothetical protein AAGG02_04835 [Cyanobacteria bacterium P01_H01_bin.15]